MRSERIGEHERLGLSLVHALRNLPEGQRGIFSEVLASNQFRATLANEAGDSYWSSLPSSSDDRCPTPFENRFRDLANEVCGVDETVPEIESLAEGILCSWWALIDDGIYRPHGDEFYRFQSKTLHEALRRGQAWFGSLSALRGLLASRCHAAEALRHVNLDVEKLGEALRGMEDFGSDSNTPLMERAFDLVNVHHDEVGPGPMHRVPRKVGTGDLLVAMLHDSETRASQLLHKIEVDTDRVKAFLATLPPEA